MTRRYLMSAVAVLVFLCVSAGSASADIIRFRDYSTQSYRTGSWGSFSLDFDAWNQTQNEWTNFQVYGDRYESSVSSFYGGGSVYNWGHEVEVYDINIDRNHQYSFSFGGICTNPDGCTFHFKPYCEPPSSRVPEPATLLLLSSGLVGLVWSRKFYQANSH